MISNTAAIVFIFIIAALVAFMVWSIRSGKQMHLIHQLYFSLCLVFTIWCTSVFFMRFVPPDNTLLLWCLDAITYSGVSFAPLFMLMIALSFTRSIDIMPKSWKLSLLFPLATNLIVWTNPFHHLHYRHFSLLRSEIVFGPNILINGIFTYLCLIASAIIMLRFAAKNHSQLYQKQCILFTIGDVTPLIISIVATTGIVTLPITATPLSFVVTIATNFIAIYKLHLLDIKPIATQRVLDWISDCYLVVSDSGLVVSDNQPFRNVFGKLYGIAENKYLQECVREEDIAGKSAVYNLITTIQAVRESRSTISYEQAVSMPDCNGNYQKYYYIADVTPLVIDEKPSGFVVILKDITQVKKSMQQLSDSRSRLMEQERLAFLGQMVGGLAHNLKTPIMSISGCVSAVENLIEESRISLGDPEVTPEDYNEIYTEMADWMQKTKDACAYMSDIITAIKGQAANVSTSDDAAFTVEELIKRSSLLMRHELLSSGCQLIPEYDEHLTITLRGDINNLIQVLNNLITNAIYAEKSVSDGGNIYIGIRHTATHLSLYVKDTGPGVAPRVKERLFKEMITSKGAKGTGLGLYISNAVVRGKFGGQMWVEDNPGGGAIFGMEIPIENVTISTNSSGKEATAP